MGITTWFRFLLDTITGGNFLSCPHLDALNAMGCLMGSHSIIVNDTTLTLEHVMQRLDAIEKGMLTKEHIENLDTKMHELANKFGAKAGNVLKVLKEN